MGRESRAAGKTGGGERVGVGGWLGGEREERGGGVSGTEVKLWWDAGGGRLRRVK